MSTPPPPPQTRLPEGSQPPPDHLIKVPGAVVNGARADYRAGFKEGWEASAARYLTADNPYAAILQNRIGNVQYGGGTSQNGLELWEDAIAKIVEFALGQIRAEPDPARREELQRSLVLKLRNLANNISPPE